MFMGHLKEKKVPAGIPRCSSQLGSAFSALKEPKYNQKVSLAGMVSKQGILVVRSWWPLSPVTVPDLAIGRI